MNERHADANAVSGIVFDETTEITIVELCRACSIDEELIDQLVDEGILEPTGGGRQWRFTYSSVRRVRATLNLQRDLGLNLAGAALALELLDRINALKAELRRR